LKRLGELDEALDNQVTELGQDILTLLLQLLGRAAQQYYEGQE